MDFISSNIDIIDGNKFVLAYFDYKDFVWYVQPRRFLLSKCENKNILLGQFIQSIWFQKEYTKNSQALFVVLKVKQDCSTKTIEKDMNGLKNPFPTLYDIPPYATNASYFIMPCNIMSGCHKKASEEDGFGFTLRAHNNPWDKLSIKIYKNPQTDNILITLPSFETLLTI